MRRHAWAQDLVDAWRQQVDYALGQDRAFFERMIPELTPWPEYGQNCPACVGRLSSMGETGLYAWDVRDSDRLVCTYCQTEYPNEAYPETGSITAPRMGQTFTFYLNDDERAHPEDRTGTHAYRWVTFPVHTSFSGVLRSKQGRWCFDQVLPLAQLYALTGDSACAERAVWILEIAASRYPHWLFHSYDGTYTDAPPADVARSLVPTRAAVAFRMRPSLALLRSATARAITPCSLTASGARDALDAAAATARSCSS